MSKLIKEYGVIQRKVNELVGLQKPVNPDLRKRQIQILKQLDDEFVKSGDENIEIYKVRIRYNAMLKYISEELGLPIDKYIENIKELSSKMGVPID